MSHVLVASRPPFAPARGLEQELLFSRFVISSHTLVVRSYCY
jgi:hypothetical protein